jgi:hypothetical protein
MNVPNIKQYTGLGGLTVAINLTKIEGLESRGTDGKMGTSIYLTSSVVEVSELFKQVKEDWLNALTWAAST